MSTQSSKCSGKFRRAQIILPCGVENHLFVSKCLLKSLAYTMKNVSGQYLFLIIHDVAKWRHRNHASFFNYFHFLIFPRLSHDYRHSWLEFLLHDKTIRGTVKIISSKQLIYQSCQWAPIIQNTITQAQWAVYCVPSHAQPSLSMSNPPTTHPPPERNLEEDARTPSEEWTCV